jgi:hypothetical protein
VYLLQAELEFEAGLRDLSAMHLTPEASAELLEEATDFTGIAF